jgi:hypothetical protein
MAGSGSVSSRRGLWAWIVLAAVSSSSALFLGGGWSTDDYAHVRRLMAHPTVLEIFRTHDPFGFYRPVAHVALLGEAGVHGFRPVLFRVVNLMIHVLVVLLAYGFARLLLKPPGAFLATLAFALTPKAHTIAIFWMSARPELMMSLFAVAALIAWWLWDKTGNVAWYLASGGFYLLAFLSKETAALLPLVLVITPPVPSLVTKRRVLAAVGLLVLATVPIWLRLAAGALMPVTGHDHYSWDVSIHRWYRSAQVYLPRALPSAAAFLMFLLVPAAWVGASRPWVSSLWNRTTATWVLYAVVWFLVFMAPVLPIAARSELYLYLSGFGFCLLMGHMVDSVDGRMLQHKLVLTSAILCTSALFAYQVGRAVTSHQVLRFTAAFDQEVAHNSWLQSFHGSLVIVPADPATERLLRDGVGGFASTALKDVLLRDDVDAAISLSDRPVIAGNRVKVTCAFDGNRVILRPE